MTPLAHLLLATAALLACACAAPASGTDLADIELEEPRDKHAAAAAPAVIAIEEKVENDLRAKPVHIPVEIIEDSHPAIKTNEVADDDEDIKRPAIDLRNPGPPQRQEHETQNADHFTDVQEKLSTVRETILQTENQLRQGIQGVSDDISNWLSTNEQVNTIQQNIQSLRDTFTNQIQKLHEGIKGLTVPHPLKAENIPESVQTQPDLSKIETSIQILENNFNKGVRALSEGVSIVAILRAEDSAAAAQPAAPTTTVSPQPILVQFISDLQTSLANSMNNITANVQNFLNPTSTVPPGVLADSPDGTTLRPTNTWPNWQFPTLPTFPNIFNGQAAGQSEPASGQSPGTATQGIIANFLNTIQTVFVRPGASATNPGTAGSDVPKPNDQKQPEIPAAVASVPAAPQAAAAAVANNAPAPVTVAAPEGPIRQILSNNPVVQSLASTVQRIQSSINNPERPRDSEKNEDLATKGGNRPNASGGNNDSGLKEQETISESKVPADEPSKPPVVLEKTE